MKKQSLIKGSLILGIAGIITRFLGLFFRWPLIMLIGDEGVGYYQMSYPLYMFFVAVASGVPVAISKLISENNVLADEEGNFTVIKEASKLMAILGIGSSTILFLFSRQIISFLEWDNKSYYSLLGISIAPAIISFLTVFRGFFQGYQNMTPSAISQILEQIGRVVVGVGLAILFLPRGIEYSAGGAALGAAAGGLCALIYLFLKYKHTKEALGIKRVKSDNKILDKIIKIAIPISLGASVGTIMNLIDSIIVPKKLLEAGFSSREATILYSQLTGKASVIVNIPLTLSMAICTSLIPIIAEVYMLKRKRELQEKIDLTTKLSMFVSIPSFLGLFYLASPILNMIFPGKAEGGMILRYLAISIPFIVLTQTTTSVMQGVGEYMKPIFSLIIGCIIKVIITSMLVSIEKINIYGAIIGSIFSYMCVSIINILLVEVKLNIKINLYNNFIKIMYAGTVMIFCVVFSFNYIYRYTLSNNLSCLLSIGTGAIIYFVAIILFKVFKIEDIKKKIKN